MPELFIQLLDRVLIQDNQPPLEEEVKAFIREKAEVMVIPRKETLVRAGRNSDQLLFLNKGIARSYEQKGDKEETTWFMQPNDLAMSPESFLTGEPSYESIELLTEAEVMSFHKSDLQQLYNRYRSANYAGRKIVEFYHVRVVRHLRDVRNMSALDSYQALLIRWPELFNLVPNKYIASFLGMHEKTLRDVRSMR